MRHTIKNIALKFTIVGRSSRVMEFISNYVNLLNWLHGKANKGLRRDYNLRYNLYEEILKIIGISKPIDYYELGVNKGKALKWWLTNVNFDSRFYGFDTFEGLPEDFGSHKKGSMSNVSNIEDNRVKFIKGMFQDTLHKFLSSTEHSRRKVVHFDADLFTSTICGLFAFQPYLKQGDILIFDEFNVPNHEWKAFNIWVQTFNIEYKIIGNRNNYLQISIEIK